MTVKNENVVPAVAFTAKDKARYTRARNAFARSGTTFRSIIGELAKQYFDGPVTVAQFASAAGETLSMGKGVTAEQKAERNVIRARIHDGLKVVDMLKVNEKASKAKRKPRAGAVKDGDKVEPVTAAEAAEAAKIASEHNPKPTQAALFAAVVDMLDNASPATLRRIANAVSVKLAAAA